MSEKIAFDPTQNASNAATALDAQINKIAQPGDAAANTAHDTLLALQNDAIPSKLQGQVYLDLLKMDPGAVDKAKQFLPDFQLSTADGNQVMRVTDNAPPQDIGVQALRDVSMQAGGEIFSTGAASKQTGETLKAYGQVSAQQEAAAFVNNDLKMLGINDEQVVATEKQPGFFSQLVAQADPNAFSGVSGEYDLVNQSGKTVQNITKYSEQYANQPGDYVPVNGMMVPTPGNALQMGMQQ
jgi:hypothetical protein